MMPTKSPLGTPLSVSICQDELLNPFAVFDFASVDVSFRVDGDRINPMELPRVMAIPAERAHHRAIFTVQDPNHVVGAVGNQ